MRRQLPRSLDCLRAPTDRRSESRSLQRRAPDTPCGSKCLLACRRRSLPWRRLGNPPQRRTSTRSRSAAAITLCAASTCKPTRTTMTVHVAGGGTARFPEAECTCPVESAQAIADVGGGNMQGSCAPPRPGVLWSLYQWSERATSGARPDQLCIAWVTAPPTAVRPPSTTYCAPVIEAARSEHRNSTVLAISSGVT